MNSIKIKIEDENDYIESCFLLGLIGFRWYSESMRDSSETLTYVDEDFNSLNIPSDDRWHINIDENNRMAFSSIADEKSLTIENFLSAFKKIILNKDNLLETIKDYLFNLDGRQALLISPRRVLIFNKNDSIVILDIDPEIIKNKFIKKEYNPSFYRNSSNNILNQFRYALINSLEN